MSRRPFHKCFHDDFLMGTVGLTLEEYGAYDRLLKLMYSRGGPIPDEPRWIAGQLNCSVRRWGQLRLSLLSDPNKLTLRGEYISNPRMERELALEEAEQTAQAAFGHMGGKARAAKARKERELAAKELEPELPLGPANDAESEIKTGLSPVYPEINPGSSEDNFELAHKKAQKSADEDQGSLKPARAFHIPYSRDKGILPLSGSAPDAKEKPPAPAKPKPRKKAKSARQLPKGWMPKPNDDLEQIAASWPDGMLARQLDRFRDWAIGNGATKKDWDAAWRNWMRKADDDWKRDGAKPAGKRSAWAYAGHR